MGMYVFDERSRIIEKYTAKGPGAFLLEHEIEKEFSLYHSLQENDSGLSSMLEHDKKD